MYWLMTTSPGTGAAALLVVYDFVNANKLFTMNLVNATASSKGEAPFDAFLSLLSYVLHHAYRSSRAVLYGVLSLATLRIILEEPTICKRLCDPALPSLVRLCRQRPPLLPPTPKPRAPACQILDIAIDTINHNLRRRLDLDLYTASLQLIHRILICLAQNHIHLLYHWSLLWQTLLSLIRFLQTYVTDLTPQAAELNLLIAPLLKSLALAIAHGNAFLPDPTAYDDLFYKLVEHADTLEKFKTTFKLTSNPTSASALANTTASTTSSAGATTSHTPIDVLISTAAHFHAILEEEKGKGRVRAALSAREVNRVIREGHKSLEVVDVSGMGVESFEVWREGEERGMVKKAGRAAVEDARRRVKGRG